MTAVYADIEGSKAITNEAMKQLTDTALGKKPKPYKGNSPNLKLAKAKMKPFSNAKRLKKAITASGRIKVPALAARVMLEAGSTEEQLNVIKLKSMINKRLPAEIRRNMGRPALINQTGRFSNSTKVNLRETKAGISGEYTYLTSPYETFENTGSRKWPTGYNPKPLIAKSIRSLALGLTTQKLVSLRRI